MMDFYPIPNTACNSHLYVIFTSKIDSIMKLLIVLSIALLSLFACKSGDHKSANDAATEQKTGPEYTSKYICPMHCAGSGSDTTGVCPKCGMDYVLNKEKSN